MKRLTPTAVSKLVRQHDPKAKLSPEEIQILTDMLNDHIEKLETEKARDRADKALTKLMNTLMGKRGKVKR